MERTAVNPWPWSVKLGFDQAQLIEGHRRVLICSGQDSVDANGNSQHAGDMAAQLALALDNLEAVLAGAGMTLAHVVRLNIYTTDPGTLLQHFPMLTERFEGSGEASPAPCSASRASSRRNSSSPSRQPRWIEPRCSAAATRDTVRVTAALRATPPRGA
jgi:enamine deaminase RidA (YjgF/YER057c/UK114 family)